MKDAKNPTKKIAEVLCSAIFSLISSVLDYKTHNYMFILQYSFNPAVKNFDKFILGACL